MWSLRWNARAPTAQAWFSVAAAVHRGTWRTSRGPAKPIKGDVLAGALPAGVFCQRRPTENLPMRVYSLPMLMMLAVTVACPATPQLITAQKQAPAQPARISREENGCFLLEKWASAQGGARVSMNSYDPGRKEWVQQWVCCGGTFINIAGGLDTQDLMVLSDASITMNSSGDYPPRQQVL